MDDHLPQIQFVRRVFYPAGSCPTQSNDSSTYLDNISRVSTRNERLVGSRIVNLSLFFFFVVAFPLICGKLYIVDLLTRWPVHNLEITTETIITISGFFGAILLLLDLVIFK
jgi:hypothetical protein